MKITKKNIEHLVGTISAPFSNITLPPVQPKENYHVITSGKFHMEMKASQKYGIPYGRDILPILYFIHKSLQQNSRKIVNSSVYEYLKMFKLGTGKTNYEEAKNRFLRIFHTAWTWFSDDDRVSVGQNKNIVDSWLFLWDPDARKKVARPDVEEFVELSEDFYENIVKHRIPFDLDLIIEIKDKPVVMGIYFFLNYRVFSLWFNRYDNEGVNRVFIPLFGPNGLHGQLSSTISSRNNFKRKMIEWLDTLKKYWPECPAYFEKMQGDGRKIYKDGLTIEVYDVSQLSVMPDSRALGSRFLRKVKKAEKKESDTPVCPDCKENHLILKAGKEMADGTKLDDYYRCITCGVNFYKSKFPDLYS